MPDRRAHRQLGRRRRAKALAALARVGPHRQGARRRVGRRARWCSLLVGPAVSGPALLLGLADHVVMTADAFAYVTGPDGRAGVHRRADHLATASAAPRCTSARAAWRRWSSPTRTTPLTRSRRSSRTCRRTTSTTPPFEDTGDPVDRDVRTRRRPRCPRGATASYDVRTVIEDVLDDAHVPRAAAELRAEPGHRPRPARRPAGRHRRQPADAPRRHARHRGVAQGGPLRRSGATRSTSRSSRSSTRPASSRAATSSGGA